jgi:hypothetical protein
MKYLRKFETEADYNAAEKSPVKAYVSLVGSGVIYDKSMPEGIYIQHIDGKLYTTNEWTLGGFSNDKANGVAVIASQCGFVVAKTDISDSSTKWYSSELSVDGLFTTADEAVALVDYNGVTNTQVIISQLSSGAAYSCANYEFPNGQKGYLPALGELAVMRDNIGLVQSALGLIGGDNVRTGQSSNRYWSSTQGSDTNVWMLFGSASFGVANTSKTGYAYIRAFAAL